MLSKYLQLWLLSSFLSPLHAQENLLPLIKNGNLNASIFLAGWQTKGKIEKGTDLSDTEGKSAIIGAGGILFQDFIPPSAQGLTDLHLRFSFRVDQFDGKARIRLRGNENDGDIVTLRPTTQGMEAYGFPTATGWKNVLTHTLQTGKTYRVVIAITKLDQPTRSYTVALSQNEGKESTSPALKNFHMTSNPRPLAETITFDTSSSNGLTVDNIEVTNL